MNDEQLAFLTRLVETTGPSGYEEHAQQVWRERVESAAMDVATDSMGNAVAVLNSSGAPRILLDAHIDEIGFLISDIDEDGFLYFSPIGGFDGETLVGNRVRILASGGPVLGVIGRPWARRLLEESKRPLTLRELWIDIGATSREEAESLVRVGDAGGRAAGLARLHGNRLVANSFDDRVGVYVVAEVLRVLSHETLVPAVIGASVVQEEIGLRGATVAAYGTQADIGIAVDISPALDKPGVHTPENLRGIVGEGPILGRGPVNNPRLFDMLEAAARAEGVRYQVQAVPSTHGTDTLAMQVSRTGMATALISIATRYAHTASEIVSIDDVDGCVTILTRFIRDLPRDVDLAPRVK
jgi:tetrahedral aminopeptidase